MESGALAGTEGVLRKGAAFSVRRRVRVNEVASRAGFESAVTNQIGLRTVRLSGRQPVVRYRGLWAGGDQRLAAGRVGDHMQLGTYNPKPGKGARPT